MQCHLLCRGVCVGTINGLYVKHRKIVRGHNAMPQRNFSGERRHKYGEWITERRPHFMVETVTSVWVIDPFTHVLSQENDDVCWICLDEETIGHQLLMSPCKCPRKVHPKCLARYGGVEWMRAQHTTACPTVSCRLHELYLISTACASAPRLLPGCSRTCSTMHMNSQLASQVVGIY